MSNDAKVTKDLMMTLKDGTDGFAKGAEKLVETNHPELATTFRKYADQRAESLRHQAPAPNATHHARLGAVGQNSWCNYGFQPLTVHPFVADNTWHIVTHIN